MLRSVLTGKAPLVTMLYRLTAVLGALALTLLLAGLASAAVVESPIQARWQALGAEAGALGAPTTEEHDVPGGRERDFAGGRIYQVAGAPAAWEATGAFLERYLALDGPAGPLGLPSAAPAAAEAGAGALVQTFTGGRIYFSPATGAWPVSGAVLVRYLALGGAASVLGLPRGVEAVSEAGPGSALQQFTGGRIYWSGPTGAHSISGMLLKRYVAIGAAASYLGLPRSEIMVVKGGWRSTFASGSITYLAGKGATITGVWRSARQPVAAPEIPFTYRAGCPVIPDSLSRILVPYYDWKGVPQMGTLVAHSSVATDLQGVFRSAFASRFPIRQIRPVDVYKGDDVTSMAADNTSAFNCRKVTGNPYRLSQHSYGNAIDINTLENPYVTSSRVYPSTGRTFLNRRVVRKGMITAGTPIARAMSARGWPWGARWSHPDYQHFSSNGG